LAAPAGAPLIPSVHFRKVAIVGVGLLGGSVGLAVRGRGLADEVAGVVRRPESVAECLALGIVTHAGCDLAAGVQGADLLLLCSPVGEMPALLERAAPHAAPNALVTDVGSVKGAMVAELEAIARSAGLRFVGSHPMAGSEKSGPAASRAELFNGAVCIVTETPTVESTALAAVSDFWTALGGRVMILDPVIHDELVARSSHLPHMVAAALARRVLDPHGPPEQARLCAGGFRDTTRVAEGPSAMWRDIAIANRSALGAALDALMCDLREFRSMLGAADAAGIGAFLSEAQQRRAAWRPPSAGGSE
jgi:prephenate dehydrogenase